MKSPERVQNYGNILENKSKEIANFSYNFNKIPPIIGVVIADQFGNTLLVFEYEDQAEQIYKPIKSYLSEDDKNLLEIDLISMYFSSFKMFAGQTNIQNLSNLEFHGSNIKVQIYFLFDKYMVILFLNSNINLNLKEKTELIQYFENFLCKHEFELKHFNTSISRKVYRILESKGRIWLKRLNKTYIQTFQNHFLEKHEILSLVINRISPTIKKVLEEYLETLPEDYIDDISRELRNRIHDEICEFNFNID